MSEENEPDFHAGESRQKLMLHAIDWVKAMNLSKPSINSRLNMIAKAQAMVSSSNGALRAIEKQHSSRTISMASMLYDDYVKRIQDIILKNEKTSSVWTSQIINSKNALNVALKNEMSRGIAAAVGVGVSTQKISMFSATDLYRMYYGSELSDHLKQSVTDDLAVYHYQSEVADLEATPGGRIILLNEASKAQRIITDVYRKNSSIFSLHSREFEEMIAELLREQGFETELTKQTRDGGYDILAVTKAGCFPVTFLAECKRWAPDRPVDVKIMREFAFVLGKEKRDKGIMFTSSYFTRDARKEAAEVMGNRLEFMQYDDIIEWIQSYIERK